MFERYTEAGRRTVTLAQEEARRLGHPVIGTEHLLLGLIAEGDGAAARAFARLGVTLEAARAQVAAEVPSGGAGAEPPGGGMMPFSPRAQGTLEAASRQALGLKSNYVDTEHVLLALLIERDARTASILGALGCPPDQLRASVLEDRATRDPDDDGDALLALAQGANVAGQALADLGVTVAALAAAVERARGGS
jgi:ATP-dependent Clp protease ATP-binding subunit ClpC